MPLVFTIVWGSDEKCILLSYTMYRLTNTLRGIYSSKKYYCLQCNFCKKNIFYNFLPGFWIAHVEEYLPLNTLCKWELVHAERVNRILYTLFNLILLLLINKIKGILIMKLYNPIYLVILCIVSYIVYQFRLIKQTICHTPAYW